MHDLGPAAHEMARLVNGVRDDQLGDPTPCPSYALGDLLQHVRGLAEAFTLAARKEQPSGGSKPPPQGGSEEARGDAFGPALPVPVGAPVLDEVIAGNGRDPAWSAN